MIEVLFGESEAGSMKVAKSNNTICISVTNGPASLIGKYEQADKKKTEWISGNSKEVICLAFMLDIGDIEESVDSQKRKDLIFSMYTQSAWDHKPEVLEELKAACQTYIDEQNRLKEFLKNGESIRIWYSDAPYSLCGFYYLCTLLKDYANEVSFVKLPEYVQTTESEIRKYSNWGEISAEEFNQFLVYEKQLSFAERRMFCNRWEELVKDNSPLRAAINGVITGVPEDFYDFVIRKHIKHRPVKEARVIGEILGHNSFGIGDWWYASRIEWMINEGEVRVVEDSERKYARTICLMG